MQFPDRLPGYAWRPVLAGIWSHRDLKDGRYTFFDLIDVNTVLDIRDENTRRAEAEAMRRREQL